MAVKNYNKVDKEYRDTGAVITEETIAGIIRIAKGEKQTFANKIFHFKGKIICGGELEFDDCTIYYHETDSKSGICYDVDYDMGIELESESSVTICNSVVICKGVAAKYFLSGQTDRVSIENTRFEDCSYFFNAVVNYGFLMMGCKVSNCSHKFVDLTYYCGDGKTDRKFEICHNRIIQDDMTKFHIDLLRSRRHLADLQRKRDDEDKRLEAIFSIFYKLKDYYVNSTQMIVIHALGEEYFSFFDNYIEETDRFTKLIREYHIENQCTEVGDNIIYKGCTFKNLSSLMYASFVRNCRFEDCTQGIGLRTSERQIAPVMDSCVFKNCTRAIFTDKGTRINNCQFVDCYDSLIADNITGSGRGDVIISGCIFFNTRITSEEHKPKASIVMSYFLDYDSMENIIRDCVFDGGQMEDAFLIAASGWNGKYKDKKIIRIQNCVFRNFTTKRSSGKIIKEHEDYTCRRLFKEKVENYQVNTIENCTGLDMVNKEGSKAESYEIMRIGSDGGEIGCSFEV